MNKLDFGVDDSFEEEKYKTIEVNISQCLSSTKQIKVPEDFEDYDNEDLLKDFVRDQIMLPSDYMTLENSWWNVDEFWVGI